MSPKKISAEFQILFHPDLNLKPTEVSLVYSFNQGRNWDTYLANKATPINWGTSMYDLPIGQQMEFFLRIIVDDGRIMIAKKNDENYKIILRDNTNQGRYKAQIRITSDLLISTGRKCLICENIVKKDRNICETPGCNAVYCPKCNRMLPPHSNYCPWDELTFKL